MKQTELANLILNDWAAARPILTGMTLDERDDLVPDVIEAFQAQPPSDKTGENLAKFGKSLAFDAEKVNASFGSKVEGVIHGCGFMYIWNEIARGDIKHAEMCHKWVAKHFIKMLAETKVVNALPGVAQQAAAVKGNLIHSQVVE